MEEIITNLRSGILPKEDEVFELCDQLLPILCAEPNMLILDIEIIVVGDVHGQFYDLLNIFSLFGDIPDKKYIFLGDLVDRGAHSIETILLLFAYKLKYPQYIYILRGNHETMFISTKYGFKKECELKYSILVYKEICELFLFLPFCAEINRFFFCIHGGLVSNFCLGDVEKYNRIDDNMEMKGVLWSDPSTIVDFYRENPRGAGQLFGQQAVNDFIGGRYRCIIRSHQLVNNGFESPLDHVYTIWSAPNYCYSCGNDAAVGKIDGEGSISFHKFTAVDDQKNENTVENEAIQVEI